MSPKQGHARTSRPHECIILHSVLSQEESMSKYSQATFGGGKRPHIPTQPSPSPQSSRHCTRAACLFTATLQIFVTAALWGKQEVTRGALQCMSVPVLSGHLQDVTRPVSRSLHSVPPTLPPHPAPTPRSGAGSPLGGAPWIFQGPLTC